MPERVQSYKTRFFVHIYCGGSEFLDTPVYIHMVTMHEYKTIMTVFIASVRQIMILPCKVCAKVTHMRFQ